MAFEIAQTHHEKFDGSGYPNGLVGYEIPLCGRIVAVADVYDALTAKRVYKEAFDHDIAKSIILEGNGTHFDPEIVDCFLTNEEKFIEIRKQFQEAEAAKVKEPVAVGAGV
jgi:putative two-component system response regulator